MFTLKTRQARQPGTIQNITHRSLRVESLEDRRLLASQAVEAINLFASDLYTQMQREDGNLLFSPLSIVTALAMTYAGAGGHTAAEMEHVLHIDPGPDIHDSFDELLTSFEDQTSTIDNFEITLADAVWPQIGLSIPQSYLDTIQTSYRGYAQSLNFSDTAVAEQIINDWVEQQTHGKIEDLVTGLLSPNTVMVLTNALYFKGLWSSPFDPDYTFQGDFTLGDGSTVSTPMMYSHIRAVRTSIDDFQVLEMPFQGGASSMVLLVPGTAASAGVVTSDTLSSVDEWFEQPDRYLETIEVVMPKFKSTVSTDLRAVLIGLGMPSAFFAGADFSGISDGIFIDDVVHKADIEVNEQGTEAAAATAVEFVICFAKGTLVLTPDGEIPIEQLRVGDQVLARNEHNLEGPVEPQLVEEVFHNKARTWELHAGDQIIRTTEFHPFFAYKKGWTPANELRVGDRLATDQLDWLEVKKINETTTFEPVYNMRVARHHTYFIGSKKSGGGIWVHNSCVPHFSVTHPFHYLIRDNVTSTISFLGRMDDPTQLENDLTPTVLEVNADFNENHLVDGGDFLTWQRNFGKSTGALHTQGDSDTDGDVDEFDLANWTSHYGEVTNGPLATATAELEQPPALLTSNANSRVPAELVDAALALEWLGKDSSDVQEETVTENLASVDLEPTKVVGTTSGRITVPSARSEFRTQEEEKTKSPEIDAWGDAILERAFQTTL